MVTKEQWMRRLDFHACQLSHARAPQNLDEVIEATVRSLRYLRDYPQKPLAKNKHWKPLIPVLVLLKDEMMMGYYKTRSELSKTLAIEGRDIIEHVLMLIDGYED